MRWRELPVHESWRTALTARATIGYRDRTRSTHSQPHHAGVLRVMGQQVCRVNRRRTVKACVHDAAGMMMLSDGLLGEGAHAPQCQQVCPYLGMSGCAATSPLAGFSAGCSQKPCSALAYAPCRGTRRPGTPPTGPLEVVPPIGSLHTRYHDSYPERTAGRPPGQGVMWRTSTNSSRTAGAGS